MKSTLANAKETVFRDHMKPLFKFDRLASSGNNLLHLVVMAHTVVQMTQRTLEKDFVNISEELYFNQLFWNVV